MKNVWIKGKLIDEKVDDDCRFVRKNKIRAETRVRILVTFHHVTLIISNEKFQFQSQSECENLKCLLPPKPLLPFHFIQGTSINPSLRFTTFRALASKDYSTHSRLTHAENPILESIASFRTFLI